MPVDLPPPDASPDLAPKPPLKLTSGVAISIGLTVFLLLYGLARLLMKSYGFAFFAVPYFAGYAVGALSARRPYWNALIAMAGSLVVLVITLREGVLCAVFALPIFAALLYFGTFMGTLTGRYVRSRRQQASAIVTSLIVAIGWQAGSGLTDDPARHPWHRVDSAVAIHAAPEVVFEALTQQLQVSRTAPFLLRMGFPIPKVLRVERPGQGGTLRMEFNHGTAWAKITAWEPGRALAFTMERYAIVDPPFHITRLGRGEHHGLKVERVTDWLTVGEIRYRFERGPGETTVLSRSTDFQRHLFPDLYFGWLEPVIMKVGQDHLLQAVRDRIEAREIVSR